MTEHIRDFVSYTKENYPIVKLEDTVYDFPLNLYNPTTDTVEENTISDYKGRWLILFFYPADFTFVCPTELKDLQKVHADFAELGDVDVLVGSTDSVFTHRAWVQKEGLVKDLQYPMFSDRDTVISKYF
jgi:peroxiredoxin (alkyl hydroperoxide reductase subunit C)